MAPPCTTATTIAPTTLLSLPVEIRLQIYNHILSTSNIHSFRPQRKIGWNRPHADLTNPALLFESDAHISLKHLFHSRFTKGDHSLILETVLHHAKVLIVDHADFTALLKIANSSGQLGHGTVTSGHGQSRSLAGVVRDHLRAIDFSDRMDEIVCQPNDIVKLVKGLPGLRNVWLTSRHVQRYSGTIEEHVEFARERSEREREVMSCAAGSSTTSSSSIDGCNTTTTAAAAAAELRRLTLRSPMTDGTRLMISPALFNSSFPTSSSSPKSSTTGNSPSKSKPKWVTVDLSMLIWQHFLYTGPPYRDHWRTHKMTTLLDVAARQNVHVVMCLRNIEFDPLLKPAGAGTSGSRAGSRMSMSESGRPWTPSRRSQMWDGTGCGLFKGEMSTTDWVLRVRQVGSGRGGVGGLEYSVRQRKGVDDWVGQEGCGVVRCWHRAVGVGVGNGAGGVCEECSGGVVVVM